MQFGHYLHGRALYESGKDRAGGLAEARAAREALAKMPDAQAKAFLANAENWLSKH